MAYPLAALGALTDTDGDGRPNDCDSACVALGMAADTDDDNDGILDTADGYPLAAIGSLTDTERWSPMTATACIALGWRDTDDDKTCEIVDVSLDQHGSLTEPTVMVARTTATALVSLGYDR